MIPRRRIDYKGRVLEEMDLDAILARQPAARPRRRARPHQRPRQPPPQALPGRRGAARRRHRRLHHDEHPARREPQRRRRPDHPHPGARDRAGLDHRPRRRHRGHRHHPRRPDPAAEGGQGLRPARPPSGRSRTTSRPATSPRCASWRCAAPPSASTPSSSPTCRPTPSPGPGPPASACWSASARTRAPPASSATPSASPTGCTRPGPRSPSRRRAAPSCSEEERDRIADTLRLAERLGGEAVTLPGGGHNIAEDVLAHARAQNVTQIVIGKSTRSRWFEILHGSVVHDLVRLSGGISVHVIAGDEVAADPIPTKTVRTRPAARRLDPLPYAVALLAVAAALRARQADRAARRRRVARPRVPDRGGRRRRPLRALAVALRRRRRLAHATTSSSCRRPTP